MSDNRTRGRAKGVYGDRAKVKRQTVLIAVVILVFIVAMVVIGVLRTVTRKNIFSLLAILSVLPFAKMVSILSTLIPYPSMAGAEAEELMKLQGNASAVWDVIFATNKTVFPIDCALIEEGRILVYSPVQDKKRKLLEESLKEFFRKQGYKHFAVVIESDYDSYRERFREAASAPEKNRKAQMLAEAFLVNCV